jgi:hypothetical protein
MLYKLRTMNIVSPHHSIVLTIAQQSYMYSPRSTHETPLGCALDGTKLVYESCSHTTTCSASGKGPWRIRYVKRRIFGVRNLGSGRVAILFSIQVKTPCDRRGGHTAG